MKSITLIFTFLALSQKTFGQQKEGDYTYSCYISIMAPDGFPLAVLTVLKNKKKILDEPVLKLNGG